MKSTGSYVKQCCLFWLNFNNCDNKAFLIWVSFADIRIVLFVGCCTKSKDRNNALPIGEKGSESWEGSISSYIVTNLS